LIDLDRAGGSERLFGRRLQDALVAARRREELEASIPRFDDDDPLVRVAVEILRAKFLTVDHYGPQQLADFHDSADRDDRARYARRAFELVQKLLSLL